MTENSRTPRVIIVALLAPMFGVTVMCLLSVLAVKGALADLPGTFTRFQRSVVPFNMIGLPIAVLLEVIVRVPVLRYLRRRGRMGVVPVLTTASLSGGIGYAAFMSVMPGFNGLVVAFTEFAIGAPGGLAADVVLWRGVLHSTQT